MPLLAVRRPSARLLAALAAAVLLAHAAAIAARRQTHAGDFDVSREFGRRFLAGEPLYAGGLHYPYLPSAALAFAPLALLPPWLGFALRYVAAVAALALAVRLLWAMVGLPAARYPAWAGLVLVLALHGVLRDLDDAGPHLLLLGLVAAGAWAVTRGHAGGAALCVGLAAAVKPPLALLLAFFAWKRQWRLTWLSAAALAAWTALPMVWTGPSAWWQLQRQWATTALASAGGMPAPAVRASEARPQNQALRPAAARVAERLGASPRGAWWAGALAAALLGAAVAWWSRRPWQGRDDPRWLAECAAVLLLALLWSPVTWVQHLVLAVPALAAIVAARLDGRAGWAAGAALALYALLSLGLNREVLGRAAYVGLLALGLHTACALLLLGALWVSTPAAPREAA